MRSSQRSLGLINSPISGRIEVTEEGVERKLLVEGATQSIYRTDGSRRGYWEKLVPLEPVASVLILGLGGGTVANWILEDWPACRVVSYELDPEVVRVARQYFHLSPKVEVKVTDFQRGLEGEESYDLIVVDLYSGYKFLPAAESTETLEKIRRHLRPGGRAAFNRVYVLDHKGVKSFEERLRLVFPKIRIEKVNLNRIYWGLT